MSHGEIGYLGCLIANNIGEDFSGRVLKLSRTTRLATWILRSAVLLGRTSLVILGGRRTAQTDQKIGLLRKRTARENCEEDCARELREDCEEGSRANHRTVRKAANQNNDHRSKRTAKKD